MLTGMGFCLDLSEWPTFVNKNIARWQTINSGALQTFNRPLYILLYENLLTDLKHELRKIFQFLNITVNDTVFDCAVLQQEGGFHRVRKPVQMKMFTDKMIRRITIATDNVSDILEARFGMRLNNSIPKV